MKGYDFEYNLSSAEEGFFEAIDFLRSLQIINSEQFLNQALADGKKILAEGAQGTFLDVDFGTYPFVTSSNTTSAGACIGLGISPRHIRKVYGIFKAYCTRVGSGPFPTELDNEVGEEIRKAGGEFGATTGRARRTGWLDMPLLRYAITLNGVTDLIMTKSDVLSDMSEVQYASHYLLEGERYDTCPFELESPDLHPQYEKLATWGSFTRHSHCRQYSARTQILRRTYRARNANLHDMAFYGT